MLTLINIFNVKYTKIHNSNKIGIGPTYIVNFLEFKICTRVVVRRARCIASHISFYKRLTKLMADNYSSKPTYFKSFHLNG